MALKSLKTNISSILEYEEEVRGLYTISDTQRLNFRETEKQQGFPSEKGKQSAWKSIWMSPGFPLIIEKRNIYWGE